MSAGGASLVGRFVAALRTCGLQPSNRVAVALSGGPDSLALASMTVWWQGFVRNKVFAAVAGCRLLPPATACGRPRSCW